MTIVFDTEATDLIPGQLCQLAYLVIQGGDVTGKNLFFSVDDMGSDAFDVHRLSLEQLELLSGGRRFEDFSAEIYRDFDQAELLVGHNVAFDERYLRAELERCGLKLKRTRLFCTMNYATGIMNLSRKVPIGRPKPPKLEELCAHYGVGPQAICDASGRWFEGGSLQHDARYDASATYLCLLAAMEKGDLRGMSL